MTEVPQIRPRRSFIFIPGLRPEMFPKALASGAEVISARKTGAAAVMQYSEEVHKPSLATIMPDRVDITQLDDTAAIAS